MKKIFFTAAMLFSLSSFAQFGIKGGYTLSKFVNQPGIVYQANSGYSLGIFYSIELTKRLFFQPEIILSKRQYSPFTIYTNSKTSYYAYDPDQKFNTLEVPLLFRYNLVEDKMPYVLGGVTPNYAIFAPYFGLNYAVTGGVGINIPVANHFILLEARVNRDLAAAFGQKYTSINLFTGFMF